MAMILTKIGLEKENLAIGTADPTLAWETMVFGDGGGDVPTFTEESTELVNEVYRCDVLNVAKDATNSAWWTFEGVIPADVGDFWIREIGILDSEGDLVAVGTFPTSYKPVLNGADDVSKVIHAKASVQLSNSADISFTIDPSVVMASQEWVLSNFEAKKEVHKFDTSVNGTDIDFTLPTNKEDDYVVEIYYVDINKTAEVKVAPADGYSIAGVEIGDTADIDVVSVTQFILQNKIWYVRRG